MDEVRCHCGVDYFGDAELFDVLHTDPLVVECRNCGSVARLDCQGIECRECELECEVKE